MFKRNWGTATFLIVVALLGTVLFQWVQDARHFEFMRRPENTLYRYLGEDPDYLNSILRTSINTSYVMDYVHHYLLDWDPVAKENIPRLVTKWDIANGSVNGRAAGWDYQ
jgi:hypothetical protein